MAGFGLIDISEILGLPLYIIIIALIWSLVWKGFALWKAVSKRHLIWFIIILVVNTLGVLEILYIFLFSEINLEKGKRKVRKKR